MRAISTVLPTNSGRIISASTRRICSVKRKLQPNTVIQHLGGIRFFYIRTLKQSWSADLTPYPKKVIHLPSILSREEVNSLIEAAPTPFQRTLLMALYATGLRRAELARLKITDIDSGRSVIHVQGGKGRQRS